MSVDDIGTNDRVIDTYREDNWNVESVKSLREFDINDDEKLL